MKRYKVRFTPEAEDDLSRLYEFLLEKQREDCELRTLTRANRDAMPEKILAWVEERRR